MKATRNQLSEKAMTKKIALIVLLIAMILLPTQYAIAFNLSYQEDELSSPAAQEQGKQVTSSAHLSFAYMK